METKCPGRKKLPALAFRLRIDFHTLRQVTPGDWPWSAGDFIASPAAAKAKTGLQATPWCNLLRFFGDL